jgi:metal-sulfur cluster biosynthetic enzyme|tara:strand:- start:8717 stop:9031 length:315 start_codon:yes stop_codon:yes gene_type:complete
MTDVIKEDTIIENLKQVYDPEISINIYDLGLIYNIEIDQKEREVKITHTLTSAFCPFADSIVEDIYSAGIKSTGAMHCEVITTFDPPFTMESVPEETRVAMGWI